MDTDDLFNSFHPSRHYDDAKRKGCQFVNFHLHLKLCCVLHGQPSLLVKGKVKKNRESQKYLLFKFNNTSLAICS